MADQIIAIGTGHLRGLDFPSNSGVAGNSVRFKFTGAALLPIFDATYIWRIRPRQQNGYYTTFFWGNDGTFLWDSGSPNTYYGAHPYPDTPPSGSTHKWEISVGGGDFVSAEAVVKDVWYQQVLRVWADGSGKHHEFYWDWPDTGRLITRTESTGWANTNPPSPALTFGDAPWNPGNESLSGVLRGLQLYNSLLNLTQIANEVSAPGGITPWYLNLDPTPTDINDKSGSGHHPTWHNSNRPTLWAG